MPSNMLRDYVGVKRQEWLQQKQEVQSKQCALQEELVQPWYHDRRTIMSPHWRVCDELGAPCSTDVSEFEERL